MEIDFSVAVILTLMWFIVIIVWANTFEDRYYLVETLRDFFLFQFESFIYLGFHSWLLPQVKVRTWLIQIPFRFSLWILILFRWLVCKFWERRVYLCIILDERGFRHLQFLTLLFLKDWFTWMQYLSLLPLIFCFVFHQNCTKDSHLLQQISDMHFFLDSLLLSYYLLVSLT